MRDLEAFLGRDLDALIEERLRIWGTDLG